MSMYCILYCILCPCTVYYVHVLYIHVLYIVSYYCVHVLYIVSMHYNIVSMYCILYYICISMYCILYIVSMYCVYYCVHVGCNHHQWWCHNIEATGGGAPSSQGVGGAGRSAGPGGGRWNNLCGTWCTLTLPLMTTWNLYEDTRGRGGWLWKHLQ